MSALDRLRKNQVLAFTNTTVTTITTDGAEKDSTVVKVVSVGVVTPQTPKIEDSQPSPEPTPESQTPDAIKTAALATGTPWRPDKIFFLRDVIPDASLDECYLAYWRAVGYVGSGHTVERSLQFTIADIRRERKARGHVPNPWLSGRVS